MAVPDLAKLASSKGMSKGIVEACREFDRQEAELLSLEAMLSGMNAQERNTFLNSVYNPKVVEVDAHGARLREWTALEDAAAGTLLGRRGARAVSWVTGYVATIKTKAASRRTSADDIASERDQAQLLPQGCSKAKAKIV